MRSCLTQLAYRIRIYQQLRHTKASKQQQDLDVLGSLQSDPRPNTSGSPPWFTVWRLTLVSWSSTGSDQPQITLSQPWISHKQHLTLACTRTPPNRRNQHSWWPLQTTTEYHSISPTSGIPKEWCQQAPEPIGANPAPWGQPPHSNSYTVFMANSHNQ